MGSLRYPFMAASAALFLLGFLMARPLLGYDLLEQQVVASFVIGILGSVVLYAVMRAISEGTRL